MGDPWFNYVLDHLKFDIKIVKLFKTLKCRFFCLLKYRLVSNHYSFKLSNYIPFKLCVQYWAWISHTFVVWSLLPVASKVEVTSKHMNWIGALCIAFHVRVHLDVVRVVTDDSDLLILSVDQSCQLSHCFRRRLRWAVMKCLSFGEITMHVTSSSSFIYKYKTKSYNYLFDHHSHNIKTLHIEDFWFVYGK